MFSKTKKKNKNKIYGQRPNVKVKYKIQVQGNDLQFSTTKLLFGVVRITYLKIRIIDFTALNCAIANLIVNLAFFVSLFEQNLRYFLIYKIQINIMKFEYHHF